MVLVAFLTMAIQGCQSPAPTQSTLSGKDLYLKARNDAIEINPLALGIFVNPFSNTPYGVVEDDVIAPGVDSTLISYASGAAGLIFSTGRGRTDGIKYQSVQIAAKKFVDAAAIYVGRMELTTDYPLPTTFGYLKFYVITPHGVYTSKEISESDAVGRSFTRLAIAGGNVINAFRLSGQ